MADWHICDSGRLVINCNPLSGLHLWYEHIFRQAMAACYSSNNGNARNSAASYSKSWGTGPQNFHGQLFHLACSLWWSVPM